MLRNIGIYRKIPTRNEIYRTDYTYSNNRAVISDISVSEYYTSYKESGYKVIKIGESDKTYTGRREYTIKYKYNIGKDPLKEADELYFNLIGNEWDTVIENVSYRITMPKKFDETKLGFSKGYQGSTDSSGILYSVDGNVISGTVNSELEEGNALTVRLTLPEGYFVNAELPMDYIPILAICVSLLFTGIAYSMWNKYGKDDEVVETVEFYPPEQYNSAEIGFLYKGKADKESVISLLIYLANKGYLKIEETKEKSLFKKSKGFKIIKLKEYDGDNKNEKEFFNGLFKARNTVDWEKVKEIRKEAKEAGEKISYSKAIELATDTSEKTTVTDIDLYDNFYTTLNKIELDINSKENKNKVFEKSSIGKIIWIVMMIIVVYLLITIKPMIDEMDFELLPVGLIFPTIGFGVAIGMIMGSEQKFTKIFGLVWGIIFGGIPWASCVLPCLLGNTMSLIAYFIGIICIIVLILCAKYMPKRTKFGNEMLGKIKGFKTFLETAEKPKLEELVSENPEYFYDILPYTYALGVSDKWIKQFETIAIKAPDWYDSPSGFSMSSFNSFFTDTMTSASTAMSSSPSSDSGGSSGGGSSGGGSGGGGGGSW